MKFNGLLRFVIAGLSLAIALPSQGHAGSTGHVGFSGVVFGKDRIDLKVVTFSDQFVLIEDEVGKRVQLRLQDGRLLHGRRVRLPDGCLARIYSHDRAMGQQLEMCRKGATCQTLQIFRLR